MNKSIKLISLSIALGLAGCSSFGPKNLSQNGICNYESVQSETYKLQPSFSEYVTNSFFYNENAEKIQQLDKSKYTSLVNSTFKILKTGVVTAEDLKNRSSYLSQYRYDEVSFDGIPYKRDKAYSTEVITSNCDVFYLAGETTKGSIETEIIHSDGSKLSDSDMKKFISPLALETINFEATITHDNFKKITKIETPSYDDLLIRGAVDDKTHKLVFIQLYADLTFYNDWGNIKLAYDTDGDTHTVTSINTDANCANSNLFGCRLTETVGAELDRKFLEKHIDGFELKFSGSQERIVKIPKMMVQSFLNAAELAK